MLIEPSATRDRLTAECFVPKTELEPVGAIEQALVATLAAEAVEIRLREAEKVGCFAGNPLGNVRDLATAAFECGVIDSEEYAILQRRNALRDRVIRVDDFPFDFGRATEIRPHVAERAT